MHIKEFRFAVQAVPSDAKQWLATAKRAEELGYSTLHMPDSMHMLHMGNGRETPSPLPSLALAAGATTTLRVGTFVLASPLRAPRLAAWDAHTVSLLSGGRFEFGIGTGRPEVADQSSRLLGQRPTGPQRLALLEQTIDHLRDLDGEQHTPVLMAASGPRARAVAAAKADIVTPAVGPLASRDNIGRIITEVREAAGDRANDIEFALPIFVVGDEAQPWIWQFLGADRNTLTAHDSLMILRGSPRQMADELESRRETLGISYLSVIAFYIEQFAPVMEYLVGR